MTFGGHGWRAHFRTETRASRYRFGIETFPWFHTECGRVKNESRLLSARVVRYIYIYIYSDSCVTYESFVRSLRREISRRTTANLPSAIINNYGSVNNFPIYGRTYVIPRRARSTQEERRATMFATKTIRYAITWLKYKNRPVKEKSRHFRRPLLPNGETDYAEMEGSLARERDKERQRNSERERERERMGQGEKQTEHT